MLRLCVSLLFTSALWGQFTSTASRAVPYASLPATCTIGQIFSKTSGSNQGFYACGPTANTFTYISGVGSIVGPAGPAGPAGAGATPCSTGLLAGPDTSKVVAYGSSCNGTTHNIVYPASVVIYDNSSPRQQISAGWTQDAVSNNVTVNFAVGQTNYYIAVIGSTAPTCTGASWATLSSGAWTALTSPAWAGLCN